MKRTRRSIGQWTLDVRAAIERSHAERRDVLEAARRLDPRLEPLEPRILLSADVGIVPDESLALVSLTTDLVTNELEIHDEVLVREPSRAEPETVDADEAADTSQTVQEDTPASQHTAGADGTEGEGDAPAGAAAPAPDDGGAEQGDPGRADGALAAWVWSDEARGSLELSEPVSQLVVVDGRVPEIASLLESLVESTAEQSADGEAAGGSEDEEGDSSDPALRAAHDGFLAEVSETDQDAGLQPLRSDAAHAAEAVATLESRGIRVIVLDVARDGLDQMDEILESFHGVAALHVVSHGGPGSLELGSSRVTKEGLEARARSLRDWARSLRSGGDILLYGCHVAEGEVGIEFVSSLASLTGADVAASDDATGGDGHGDWVLEHATGTIEAQAFVAASFDAALVDEVVTGTAADDVIRLSWSVADGQWTATVNGGSPQTFVTPTAPDGITIDAGDGSDKIIIESLDESFAGTISVNGGADGSDGDQLIVLPADTGSVTITPNGVETVTDLSQELLDADALIEGLDALVAWAERLDTADRLGLQLAGLSGTSTVGVGTAMDLADVFQQLRDQVVAGIEQNVGGDAASDEDLSVEQLRSLLEALTTGVASGDDHGIRHDASALVGDAIAPTFTGSEGFQFKLTLDGVEATIAPSGGVAASDLSDLASKLNTSIASSDLSGQVRAIVVGFAPDGDRPDTRRLAFQVVDASLEKLTVEGLGAGAGLVGFTPGDPRTLDGLDKDLKGLGRLQLNVPGAPGTSLDVTLGVELDGATPVWTFDFHLRANRTTGYTIDLGEHAEEVGLAFDGTKGFDLATIFESQLVLRVGEADAETDPNDQDTDFGVDVRDFSLSAQIINAGLVLGEGIFEDPNDPLTMNVGFLGAQIDDEAQTTPRTDGRRGQVELQVELDANADWNDLQISELASDDVAGRIMNQVDLTTDRFVVDLPVEIKKILFLFDPSRLPESLVDLKDIQIDSGELSALDGRQALVETHFEGFDAIEGFASIDAPSYVALLGQLRSGLESIRQSDLLKAIDLPFVQGAVSTVADLADAFGDAILFDDGDDGLDSQNTNLLVTTLNEALRDAKLQSLLQFRVDDPGDGSTKLALEALSKSVTHLGITGASTLRLHRLLAEGRSITGDKLDLAEILNADKFSFTVSLQEKGEAARNVSVELDWRGKVEKSLNAALKKAKLETLLEFEVNTDGRYVLKKKDDSGVVRFEIKDAKELWFNDTTPHVIGSGDPTPNSELVSESTAPSDIPESHKIAFTIKLYMEGGDYSDGGDAPREETIEFSPIGNDVAKLLDAANTPTFATAQELAAKLAELALEAVKDAVGGGGGDEGPASFRYVVDEAAGTKRLFLDLDFSHDLVKVDLPVAFDLDLGPIGNVGTEGDPKITIGGEVGFNISLGLELGDLSSKEISDGSDGRDPTKLEDLANVDEITDVVKLTPSITAERDPGTSVNDDSEDKSDVTISETQMGTFGTLIFGAAQTIPVDAEPLINGVMNLTSPEGTVIHVMGPLDDAQDEQPWVTANGRTVPLRGLSTPAPAADGDGYVAAPLIFKLRIDTQNGALHGDPFTVTLPQKTYSVSTVNAAKLKWQDDVEKAISQAQGEQFDSTIRRTDGSWTEDGFAAGDVIRIEGAGSNDGVYTIDSIDEDTQGEDRILVLKQDLAAQSEHTSGVEIEGPGRIQLEDRSGDFLPGERILVTGSELGQGDDEGESNDGAYLISRVVLDPVDGDTLVVAAFMDEEGPTEDIVVRGSGAPVNLEVDDTTQDARFELNLEIENVVRTVTVVVSRDGKVDALDEQGQPIREEGADSNLSDNRTLSDLVLDVQNAVDAAIDAIVDEIVEDLSDDEQETIRGRAPELKVGLDGNRLVLTLDNAARVTGEPLLGFVQDSQDDDVVHVTRSAASGGEAGRFTHTDPVGDEEVEGDGFRVGQIVQVLGTTAFDRLYRVVAADELTLELELVAGEDPLGSPSPEADLTGAVVTQTFSLSNPNSETEELLGFEGPVIEASFTDLVVVFADDGVEDVSVTLDGSETVADVVRKVNEALGDKGKIELNEDKTGFVVVQTKTLTGNPYLDFDGDVVRRPTTNGGSWEDDGFEQGDLIRISGTNRNDGTYRVRTVGATELTLENEDGSSLTLNAERSIRGVTIMAAVFDQRFRVESINASTSALRLGILRADATSDENLDGLIDQRDGDGVIDGLAIGGASLFDRFFIWDPTVELALEVEAPDITINGDFGFFEVGATASGDITAVASLSLSHPDHPDDDEVHPITLRDLWGAIRSFEKLKNMIQLPEFGGATLDVDAGDITFENDGDKKGKIERSDGSWEDDRFKKDQKITVVDKDGTREVFQILEISDNGKVLTVDGPVAHLTAGNANGEVEVESAVATLTAKDLDLGSLNAFRSLAGLDDARVVVSLLDLGNPFFREVVEPASDSGTVATLTELNILTLGIDFSLSDDVEAGDTLDVELEDAQGALVVASAIIKSVDDKKITLEENLVDDKAGLRVKKLTVTRPPKIDVDTPDLSKMLDFSQIGWEQILDGLIALSDFLEQFEEFAFLNEDIPLVGVSINDLIGYADDFRDAVNAAKADPAGSFQKLESQLEALLGIDDGTDTAAGQDPFDIELTFETEVRGEEDSAENGETDDHAMAKLELIIGAGFAESLGVGFDLGEYSDFEGVLSGAADLAASGEILLRFAVGIDLTQTKVRGDAKLTFKHDDSGDDTITRDVGSFLEDGFMVGQHLDLDDAGDYSGDYEIKSIENGGRTITLKSDFENATSTDAVEIADAELIGERSVSLFGSTGIEASLQGVAEDLSFRAAIGPFGLFVREDSDAPAVTIGGNLDGDGKIFDAGLQLADDPQAVDDDMRILLQEVGFDDFGVNVGAGIDATLPVFFPVDSNARGVVKFDAGISGQVFTNSEGKPDVKFDFQSPKLEAFRPGDEPGELGEQYDNLGQLFNFLDMLDLGELSIFDNILLAVDGIDFFLGGLQDVLDGEVFGIELPLIGDSLADGAKFIEDLREGFLQDFRDGVEDAEDFVQDLTDPNKNVISTLLFDLLAPTRLLLVELDDGSVITATQEGLDAGLFELGDAIKLNGESGDPDLPDLTASVNELRDWIKGKGEDRPEIKWNMKLGQSLIDVDTDLDIDLGIPGLGFEAEGPLGLRLGWDLDFGFGLNFDDGFFLDIAAEDGTDLEVNVDVTLPDRLSGTLAFLQLDAINDGSALGAKFVVDIYNADDPEPPDPTNTAAVAAAASEIDQRLSFGELGKLRVRAEVAAEARAEFDMLLSLSTDLIPSAQSVFPTVGADFVLDWGLGGVLGDAGEISFDGNRLERGDGSSWEDDGFRQGQRIVVSGFDDADLDGEYFIAGIAGATLTLTGDDTGQNGTRQSGDLEILSFVNIRDLSGNTIMDGLSLVEFQGVNLDLGSFIGDLIAPILGEIQGVTQPLQPIIDIMTTPLPVLSEFAGETTLLDLAAALGDFNPAFLESVANIITLVNSIPAEKGEVKIPFGDFTIYRKDSPEFEDLDLTDPNADLSKIDKNNQTTDDFDLDKELDKQDDAGDPNTSKNKKSRSFAKKLKNLDGLTFPFLTDPTQIFGLFTGEPVTLVAYDMPPLDFDFQWDAFIRIYGPLGVSLGGSFGAEIDFAFGFDTYGINQFADSGFRNPLLIFNGLYVSDNPTDATGAGPDLPELTFRGEFTAAAELNVVFARAGAGGGIGVEVFFDLFDPDHDGRVRIGEIVENFVTEAQFGSPILAPLAIFDVSGNVKARLFAYIEIELFVASIYKEFNIVPPITLVDFDINFQRKPKLAAELPDDVLQLNMGDFAGQRLNGDLSDGNEHFIVEDAGPDKIRVKALGLGPIAAAWQEYDRPKTIIALGGAGNDVIDLSGLTLAGIKFELEGGEGNDVLIGGSDGGGTFVGGLGDDVIVGSGGDDVIYGNEGSDVIDGSGGDDIIFADGGRLVEGESKVSRVELEVVPEQGTIFRSDGVSWADDGFKKGQTIQIKGSTLAVEGATEGPEAGNNGFYMLEAPSVPDAVEPITDLGLQLFDMDGNPVTLAYEKTDKLTITIVATEYLRAIQGTATGSDGDDLVLGGAGSDSVLGSGGADTILGGGVNAGFTGEGLRAWAAAKALEDSNGVRGATARVLREQFSASAVADDDGAGSGVRDILIGDTGQIRYRLGRTSPILRDVVETDRGPIFDADVIYGNGGADIIHAGQGADEIHGGSDDDVIHGEQGKDVIFGDAGADEIHGGRDIDEISGGSEGDTIYGDAGNDLISGNDGEDEIFGGTGDDVIDGGEHDDVIDGGSDVDRIQGGGGRDTIDGGFGDDFLFGGDGADNLIVRAGSDALDGEDGGDEYIVTFRGAENDAYIPIHDTGSALDTDRLTVNGTDFADLFLLRALDNDPEFDAFVTSINAGDHLERIDYDGVDRVVVNGLMGDDEFAVDDVGASTELNGGGGRDLFKVGQLYKTERTTAAGIAERDVFDTIHTTRGWLSNGTSQAMVINAGADDDEIIVLRNIATVQVNGEEGDDKITVRAFVLAPDEVAKLPKREETEIVGGAGADLIQYAVNAPVNIDGGDGLDQVTVIGTEFADDFVINERGVYGAGLNVNLVNVELLTVDGAEGDDAFYVQGTQEGLITQILGGLGSDTFDVAGDAPPVISNDLLGHSGIITHGIETEDPLYQGADGDGIAIDGISANVADDDEPFVRISQSDGSTRVRETRPGEVRVIDTYTVVLTRALVDDEEVRIKVFAPSQTPEQKGRGAYAFTVDSPTGVGRTPDGTAITLVFNAQNWSDAQTVQVEAVDDGALEGERFGVINHQVESDNTDYDGLALPSVAVQIDDRDEADVLIHEVDGYTRVSEGSGVVDAYGVQLSRPPVGTVEVRIDVTPPPGVADQIAVSSPTGVLDGSTLVLTFDDTNWNVSQTVEVEALDDDAREGFHRDFIEHRVESVGEVDVDQPIDQSDTFQPDQKDQDGVPLFPSTSVLLSEAPIQQTGVIGAISGTQLTIEYGSLGEVDSLVGWAIRLSTGPADGQVRTIVGNTGTTIELDSAFEIDPNTNVEADLVGSNFRISNVQVTIDPASLSGNANVEILENGHIVRTSGSWFADQFQRGQTIVVEGAGDHDGLYVIAKVSAGVLETIPVVVAKGGPVDRTDSGELSGVSVEVAPLPIDRFTVTSSTVVFLDESGRPETRDGETIRVDYQFNEAGYHDRREERVSVDVVDDDTAGVVITQTDFSTDVTEGSGPADTYTVVLSRKPESVVHVVVRPEITRTSGGLLAYEQKQVEVSSNAAGAEMRGDELVLEFTPDDWNVEQVVTVTAIDDDVVDGNDTQVFAPAPHVVAGVQGPLMIDGAGGDGSLEGLARPVMLAGETSQLPADGTVDGIDASSVTVARDALLALTPELASLVDRTVELIDLPGAGASDAEGRFTRIVGVTELGGGRVRLELDPGWPLSEEQVGTIAEAAAQADPADRWGFAITDESANFFEIETEQVDVLRMNDEDNPAFHEKDGSGASNSFGHLTYFDHTQFPDTMSLLAPDAGEEAFTQGQWGRITGLGMGPDSFIGRADRPGGVTYGNLEGLEINLGLGDNLFTIDAVHQRNDGVRTWTIVNANDGDDTVLVSVAAPQDPSAGVPFLRIDAGEGNDRVVAAVPGLPASTLAMEIFGGFGNDFLRGGLGNDLIYGDFGTSAITNVVDLDAELALRELAKRASAEDAAADSPHGEDAAPSAALGLQLPERRPASVAPIVESLRPGRGGHDVIEGMGGNDLLFGGWGHDTLRGGAGNDVLFGDHGRVTDLSRFVRLVETTHFFQGGDDALIAGTGNDVLLGGAGNDGLLGSFDSDVMIGEYARITYDHGLARTVVRLGQGTLDLAASSIFRLYEPVAAPDVVRAAIEAREAAPVPEPGGRAGREAVEVADPRLNNQGGGFPPGRHVVASGDTLWDIAEDELGSAYRWPEIAERNRHLIVDPNRIEPGWVIQVPGDETDPNVAELFDAAATRERLAQIDAQGRRAPQPWAFSQGGDETMLPQVGEGPPDAPAPEGETTPQERAPEAPGDSEPDDRGASRGDPTGGDAGEFAAALWAGLTGWRTRTAARRRRSQRWLAFDPASGRFQASPPPSRRDARDAQAGRW